MFNGMDMPYVRWSTGTIRLDALPDNISDSYPGLG